MAVAAYNMGPGAVDKNIAQNQGQFNVAQAPQETQGYLGKVLGGVGKAVKVDGGEPISASTQKHIDDMLELNKPPKKSLMQKYTDKMSDLLGLE